MIKSQLCQLLLVAAASAAAPLQIGQTFPAVAGQTVSGTLLELPSAGAGRTQVLEFSFSFASGSDCRVWNEHLEKDFGADAEFSTFSVMMLESVPKLFRGLVTSGVRSRMPSRLWNKTALVYKEDALWKSRLAVSSDNCYIVLLSSAARVSWLTRGPFTDAEYAQLKMALHQLITAASHGKDHPLQ